MHTVSIPLHMFLIIPSRVTIYIHAYHPRSAVALRFVVMRALLVYQCQYEIVRCRQSVYGQELDGLGGIDAIEIRIGGVWTRSVPGTIVSFQVRELAERAH